MQAFLWVVEISNKNLIDLRGKFRSVGHESTLFDIEEKQGFHSVCAFAEALFVNEKRLSVLTYIQDQI